MQKKQVTVRWHFVISTIYLIISESICISRDIEGGCHKAFDDETYIGYGIGFIILGVALFVYSLWKPYPKEDKTGTQHSLCNLIAQRAESSANLAKDVNAASNPLLMKQSLFVLFKVAEFIFLNIGTQHSLLQLTHNRSMDGSSSHSRNLPSSILATLLRIDLFLRNCSFDMGLSHLVIYFPCGTIRNYRVST